MSEEQKDFELRYSISDDHRNPIECITGDLAIAVGDLYISSLLDTTERIVMLTVKKADLPEVKSAMDDLGLELMSEKQAA